MSILSEREFPGRQYRVPEEICIDVRRVIERLREINDAVNVRNLIAEVISAQSGGDGERRAQALNELFESAAEALSEMSSLEEALDDLRAELYDAMA